MVADQTDKTLIGIVTDRDLTITVLVDGRDPRKVKLEEIMSRHFVSCSPDDEYDQALNQMEKHRIRRIPAVDNSGRVVGISSQSDVALRVGDAGKTVELVTDIARQAETHV